MAFLLLLPAIFCHLLLAAHWMRTGNVLLVVITLLVPLLLFVRRRWAALVVQLVLVAAAAEWTATLLNLATRRMEEGEPWLRAVFILAPVVLFNLGAIALFYTRRLRGRYNPT